MGYTFPGDSWIIFSLQNLGDWITPAMSFFTWLGYPQAYMIIIAIVYWSVDRKLGLRLAIFLPVVSSLNSILKQAIHAPRPFWLDPGIKGIRISNGFGMPSGHAQASVVWIYAGIFLKRRWFWALAIAIVLMVGISRMHLGVHFPSQVLAGWIIGLVVVFLFIRLETGFLSWFLPLKFKYQMLFISGISIIVLLLGAIFVFLLRDWELPAQWIMNSMDDLAGSNEEISYSIGIASLAGNTGGFLGVAAGALILHRMGGFEVSTIWWKRVLGSAVGLLIFIVLYGIFMATAPDQGKSMLYAIWRFSGFFVISFTAILLVPILLIRINLLKPSGK